MGKEMKRNSKRDAMMMMMIMDDDDDNNNESYCIEMKKYNYDYVKNLR